MPRSCACDPRCRSTAIPSLERSLTSSSGFTLQHRPPWAMSDAFCLGKMHMEVRPYKSEPGIPKSNSNGKACFFASFISVMVSRVSVRASLKFHNACWVVFPYVVICKTSLLTRMFPPSFQTRTLIPFSFAISTTFPISDAQLLNCSRMLHFHPFLVLRNHYGWLSRKRCLCLWRAALFLLHKGNRAPQLVLKKLFAG